MFITDFLNGMMTGLSVVLAFKFKIITQPLGMATVFASLIINFILCGMVALIFANFMGNNFKLNPDLEIILRPIIISISTIGSLILAQFLFE